MISFNIYEFVPWVMRFRNFLLISLFMGEMGREATCFHFLITDASKSVENSIYPQGDTKMNGYLTSNRAIQI